MQQHKLNHQFWQLTPRYYRQQDLDRFGSTVVTALAGPPLPPPAVPSTAAYDLALMLRDSSVGSAVAAAAAPAGQAAHSSGTAAGAAAALGNTAAALPASDTAPAAGRPSSSSQDGTLQCPHDQPHGQQQPSHSNDAALPAVKPDPSSHSSWLACSQPGPTSSCCSSWPACSEARPSSSHYSSRPGCSPTGPGSGCCRWRAADACSCTAGDRCSASTGAGAGRSKGGTGGHHCCAAGTRCVCMRASYPVQAAPRNHSKQELGVRYRLQLTGVYFRMPAHSVNGRVGERV